MQSSALKIAAAGSAFFAATNFNSVDAVSVSVVVGGAGAGVGKETENAPEQDQHREHQQQRNPTAHNDAEEDGPAAGSSCCGSIPDPKVSLVVAEDKADWVRKAHLEQARRNNLIEARNTKQCRIPEVKASSKRTLLIAGQYEGNLPTDVGKAYEAQLKLVKKRRSEEAGGLFEEATNDCLAYFQPDVSDEWYEPAVTWSVTMAHVFGFSSLREVRLGPSNEKVRRLDPATFRAAIYDCPAVTFGGGNPALAARNILHLKTVEDGKLYAEFVELIERGLIFVFAYSCGGFMMGKHAQHWLASPDLPDWLADVRAKGEQVEKWVSEGTLDLVGSALVKTHFNNEESRLEGQKQLLRWMDSDSGMPADGNGPPGSCSSGCASSGGNEKKNSIDFVYGLADGDAEGGSAGMDYMVVNGDKMVLKTSGLFKVTGNGPFTWSNWDTATGFYNKKHPVRAAAVMKTMRQYPSNPFAPGSVAAKMRPKKMNLYHDLPRREEPLKFPPLSSGEDEGTTPPAGDVQHLDLPECGRKDVPIRSDAWLCWELVLVITLPVVAVLTGAVVVVLVLCRKKKRERDAGEGSYEDGDGDAGPGAEEARDEGESESASSDEG